MRKKIVGIIVCMLLISSTTTMVFFSNTVKVEASGGGPPDEEINLDYDWVWLRVQDFANVIRKVNWSEGGENGIPKGRCWATAGEYYTIDTILWPNMGITDNPCGLTNYQKLQIGPIPGSDRQYSSKVVLNSFNLTINHNNYPYPNPIPYSEIYANPTGKEHWKRLQYPDLSYDIQFDNCDVKTWYVDNPLWPFGGTLTGLYKNISCEFLNDESISFIDGEVVYLPENAEAPIEQEGIVFLVNDSENCQEKIDNLTNASGLILITLNRGIVQYANVTNVSSTCALISSTSTNLSDILTLLDEEDLIFIDNINNENCLTFTYGISELNCPSTDSFLLYQSREPPVIERHKPYKEMFRIARRLYRLNQLSPSGGDYIGIICYDYNDTHVMGPTNRDWRWAGHYWKNAPFLPIFSINFSIGHFLLQNEDAAVSGDLSQTYYQQTSSAPGVETYDVVATREGADESSTVILNNRIDGFWSEAPGDSGVSGAVILGVAKYFEDNDITPKCNVDFLFTTGEEYGMRGNYYYHDKLQYEQNLDKVKVFLAFDQCGLNQSDTRLGIGCNNENKYHKGIYKDTIRLQKIVEKIVEISNYEKRTNSGSTEYTTTTEKGGAGEEAVWSNDNCFAIGFVKDPERKWGGYHRSGRNHTRGDCLYGLVPKEGIDRQEVNVSFELAWNITKYFTVNPNCWFNNTPTYQLWDSNHDSKMDSVNVSFSVNTILPHDRTWVKATLVSEKYPRYYRFTTEKNYIITPSGVQDTLTVTLPREAPQGNYSLKVYLYNSTGEIDRRCSYPLTNYWDFKLGSKYANEKYEQGPFWMHPANLTALTPEQPSGDDDIMVGIPHFYTASTTDPEGDPIWYQWNYETSLGEMLTCWDGPYNSGQGDTKLFSWISPGIYNVSVRAKYLWNPNVKSDWSEVLPVTVSPWFGDPVEWNNDLLDDLSQTVLAVGQQTYSNGFAPGVSVKSATRESLNWTWEFGDGNVSYGENASHSYSQVGNYRVILRIRNSQGYYYNCSKNVTVLLLNAGFTTRGDIQGGKTALFNDTSAGEYQMENWSWDFGDGTVSYQRNTSHVYTADGVYNVTLTVRDIENNTHFVLRQVVVESAPPQFIHVAAEPDIVGFGFPVTISADVYEDYVENQSGVRDIWVNLTYPDNTTQSFPMNLNVSSEHDYTFTFNDTWQAGVYNYSIYVNDYANNTNTTGLNFTVSAEADITVCTTKDTYTGNEFINLTDPPGAPAPSLGYELLDDGAVLHLWNQYDSYYFNTSSGVQLTNHKNQYWSHNVLMLGYYNNDQWNLMYRTDELTGFSQTIETDTINYVNITLWKDLTYAGYQFRLALRYHLGVNDHDLTVIPSIKNIGTNNIPYVLGFGWELKDIQINMTSQGDYILVDQDTYLLNQTLDNSYTSLNETVVYIMEDVTGSQTKSLYLRWNLALTFKLLVKSRTGQTNAPVTLFVRIGMLAAGQQKHTLFQWYDASQETYYFDSYDEYETWEYDPELMTDENEGTFASTSVESDVEICNGNTCEGEDHGEILKVEVRVHGYHEGEQGNITLVPVFGENRGESYMFVTSGQSEWSPWFDITDDEGRGTGQGPSSSTWNWSEVETLGCHVISHASKGTTLYCSKVELRVTYNTAPSISNPSPSYGVNGIPVQSWVNITASDPNNDTMNITWYSNSTPTLLTLRPNMNGSIAELQRYPTSENANYKCVDETTVNDNDYVYWSGTSWKKDSYNLANHGTTSGVIKNVTVYARCNREGVGLDPGVPNAGKIVIKSGSSYYDGNEFTPTSTFTSYSHTWSVNPATGTAWDWSAIDALEAGIAFIGNEAGDSKCSQVYVVVTYVNPSTWLQFGSNSSVNNGVYRQRFLNASVNGQWWYWKVKADDGTLSTWSSVYKFYTGYQSKIENTGETDISGYLLMQVQYYDESLGEWVLDIEVVNQSTRQFINIGEQLGLDQFFNGEVNTEELTHGAGLYRVYAAFRDPEGDILITDNEVTLAAWYEFEVNM